MQSYSLLFPFLHPAFSPSLTVYTFPYLTSRRFLRGDAFADKHWIDMFRLVGLPKTTQIETLTLDHFLAVVDKVRAHLN